MKPRRNPSKVRMPREATPRERAILESGGIDDGEYGEHAVFVSHPAHFGSDDLRIVEVVNGRWWVATHAGGETTRRRFTTRADAYRYAARNMYAAESHRNPDWHTLAATAKEKARRAHEWSKPHAAKAWEATKVGAQRAGAAAKRGSKKAAGSLAAHLHDYAVANPDYGSATTDAEIRRHVASEASTANGHKALAEEHRRESDKFFLRGNYIRADYHYRMADAHEAVGHSLSRGSQGGAAVSVAFVIHATERSSIEFSVPTVAEITNAFRAVERGVFTADGVTRQRSAASGGWVGPAPRVTRSAPIGAFVTQAAWVWYLDDTQQAASGLTTTTAQQAFVTQLVTDVATSLRERATHNTVSGDDWTVDAAAYSPAVNGPLSWWRSGDATRATFVNEFPQLTQRTLQLDNPIGPTAAMPDTGVGSGLRSLAWIAGAVAVVVVAVEVAPLISGYAAVRKVANPRKNRR